MRNDFAKRLSIHAKGEVMREEDAKCLTDNEVAGFVEGNVQPDELPRLEGHLAECAKCLEIVLAVFNSLADSRHLVPGKASRQ